MTASTSECIQGRFDAPIVREQRRPTLLTVFLARVIQPSLTIDRQHPRREMQAAITTAVQLVANLRCTLGMHQQRLPERSVDDEIQVLLKQHLAVPACLEQLLRNLGAIACEHDLRSRLRQISQTARACALHHLEEVAGRVERLQFLVQQVIIPGVPSDGLVISQHPAKHAVGRGHLLQEN